MMRMKGSRIYLAAVICVSGALAVMMLWARAPRAQAARAISRAFAGRLLHGAQQAGSAAGQSQGQDQGHRGHDANSDPASDDGQRDDQEPAEDDSADGDHREPQVSCANSRDGRASAPGRTRPCACKWNCETPRVEDRACKSWCWPKHCKCRHDCE
jgi:hypothetical protein